MRGCRRAVVCLLAALALAAAPRAPGQTAGETLTLTVLATTDLHGHVWPYDYLEGRDATRGLARVASYVQQARARQPNTLLVDCGDTFQGTPLAYLSAEKYPAEPNPMVAAMNALGYDALAPGNHEWDYGLYGLWRLKEESRFPWLAANVVSTYHDSRRDFPPYLIRTVGGARVALLGMTLPTVPKGQPAEHLVGYEFRDLVETARRYVPELRRKADVVIVFVHAGLGRDPETGRDDPFDPEGNRVGAMAEQVPGIDVIFFGHSHQELAGKEIGGALLVQPRFWGQSVAEVELTLAREHNRWRVAAKRSRVVPMDTSIPPAADILELTRAAHQRAEQHLNTVLTELGQPLEGRTALVEDHPLGELVRRAMLAATGAQVALGQPWNTTVEWRAGPLTVRDVWRLYRVDSKLVVVELTGAELKETLEQSAANLEGYPRAEGASPLRGPWSLLDMAEGVSYRVDLTKPVGERITELRFENAPLDPARQLTVAVSSNRLSARSYYSILPRAKVVKRTNQTVRDAIINYLLEQKKVPAADHNWEIVPPEARPALVDFVPPRP